MTHLLPNAETLERGSMRMEPLATLPVFFKLNGKRVMMAGGDPGAAWKAELLAAAGAQVEAFAPVFCDAFDRLAASPPSGGVMLRKRRWETEDLRGATLAIGAIEDDGEAADFRMAASAAGVPVNVVDKPAFCDFQFGTIVARSPLVIGISTDGGAPVFGQALRARLEALLPQNIRAWAQAAKDWRPAVQARDPDFRWRRRFWEAFTARALAAGDRLPTIEDQNSCLEAAMSAPEKQAGRVTLVGCGPGTLGSLTFDAAHVLQSADIIVHEPDVLAEVVGMARREAIKMTAPDTLNQSIELLGSLTTDGKQVVWLGKGDPMSCSVWLHRFAILETAVDDVQRIPGLRNCSLSSREHQPQPV